MTTPPRTFGIQTVAWLAALLMVALMVIAVFLLWPRNATPTAREWTAEWRADPPVVSTIPGGLLEAATVRMAEEFYKSDNKTWWGLYLGTTVSHIQVSATYRYGVTLADPSWEIVTRGQTTVVIAPSLRPSLPVAIDTGTLRERTASGWARFDKQVQLEELRRSLSGELEARANDPARLALARDAARHTIGEFVEQWLLTHGEWESDVFRSVKVYFLDEVDDDLRSQLRERR